MNKVFDGNVLIMVALVTTLVRDVVVFSNCVGIAQTSGEIGNSISVATRGVYEFPSVEAEVIVVGDVLYWDNTNKVATLSDNAGANVKIGTSWSAKTNVVGNLDIKIG